MLLLMDNIAYGGKIKHVAEATQYNMKKQISVFQKKIEKILKKMLTGADKGDKIEKSLEGDRQNGL